MSSAMSITGRRGAVLICCLLDYSPSNRFTVQGLVCAQSFFINQRKTGHCTQPQETKANRARKETIQNMLESKQLHGDAAKGGTL